MDSEHAKIGNEYGEKEYRYLYLSFQRCYEDEDKKKNKDIRCKSEDYIDKWLRDKHFWTGYK